MKTFLDKFAFDPKNAGAIGVERERFFVRGNQPVPMAEEFFAQVRLPWLTYELSACQLEDHVFWPFTPWWHEGNSGLAQSLESNDRIIAELGRRMNFGTCQCAVASADMPLDVYPLPRYLELVKKMDRQILAAACRVAGTHIHIGMPNMETAIMVYNAAVVRVDEMISTYTNPERFRLYQLVEPKWRPSIYSSPEHFAATAEKLGFVVDPRSCWHIVRISIHGTVEFRLFDSVPGFQRVCHWAKKVYDLAAAAAEGRLPERKFILLPRGDSEEW